MSLLLALTPVVPTPPADIPVGGAGHPTVWWGERKRKKEQTLDEFVVFVVADYYKELTEPEVKQSVKKEAAKIVRPYAKDGLKVPEQVNWAALYQDAEAISRLIELYQRQQIISDDDEWLMLH